MIGIEVDPSFLMETKEIANEIGIGVRTTESPFDHNKIIVEPIGYDPKKLDEFLDLADPKIACWRSCLMLKRFREILTPCQ